MDAELDHLGRAEVDPVYPDYQDKIAADHRESFPLAWVIAENLLHLSTWVVAGWLLWPVQVGGWPVATAAWAALVLVVQTLLKKHNCSGCYYYGQRCHLGWGKLSALMCAQDSGNLKTGQRLSLFYVVSPPVILVAAVATGLLLDVGTLHWVLLGVFIALNAVSFPVRAKGCGECAMREVCPGSAAKGS